VIVAMLFIVALRLQSNFLHHLIMYQPQD